MKKLPISIQSFKEIRGDNYIYIDKTEHIYNLVQSGKYYFLSRPRRFGKSLLIDTIHCLFEGRKELFEGLFIYDKWDWNTKYPVIHIDFSRQKAKDPEMLAMYISDEMRRIGESYGIRLKEKEYFDRFNELIIRLSKTNKVVILIDEYDKPIIDNIEDEVLAKGMREVLKGFYQVIKGCDEYIRFVMLTGVSKFSKVSLFSGLNNLNDITIDERYGTICGYTQSDIEREFREYLEGVDIEKVKLWYNGYSWLSERVYNPFDILLFFDKGKEFKSYWFETGSPEFLIKLFHKNRYYIPSIENVEADESLLSSFDVDFISPVTLLFQTGYLTIKCIREELGTYILEVPNLEVRKGLMDSILKYYSGDAAESIRVKIRIYEYLTEGDIKEVVEEFKRLFESIPYDWYRKNKIDRYEGYYASIFYSVFHSLGLEVIAEDVTNKGRIDLTVIHKDRVYIFEFKVKERIKERISAINQIKKRRYADKYRVKYKEIYLIGIEFSEKKRNIVKAEFKKHIHKREILR